MIAIQPVIDAIKKELGSFFATEAHRDSDIYRYISSAISYIYNYRDFSFTKKIYSLSYNTALTEVAIPYNVKTFVVRGTYQTDPYIVLDQEAWFMRDDKTGCVGIWGDVFIAPTTGVFQIMYSGIHDPITSATTEVDLPPNFEYTLKQIAIHFGYKDTHEYDKAGALLGEANAFLNNVANRTSNPLPSQPIRIGANHRW